jgi:acyl carrier protein
MSSPANFWNSMSPAQRLEFIVLAEKTNGVTIGHSNSKNRFEKLPSFLADIVTSHTGLVGKVVKMDTVIDKAAEKSLKGPKDLGELKAIVNNAINDLLGTEDADLTDDASFESLGADSLDFVELIMEFEKEFDIEIEDEIAEGLDTYGKVISHLAKQVLGIEVSESATEETKVSDELDLVISFDDTGSMSSVRKQVRNHVNELVKTLFNDIPKLRVGIIIHNDYCDMPRHIFTQDFTSDLKAIEKFVNSDSPCGGGDAPECYELALHEASKFNWKSDRRALIMIGDEVPHAVGYRYGSHTNNIDWKKEIEALAAMDVKVYGVQALGRRSSNYFYEGISNLTGGIKLDLSQFQHISTYINAIAYHQSGQLDAYQSSDPSFNTNIALKNMFNKLKGGSGSISADKIELLSKFQVMRVDTEMEIRNFVEANGCTFSRGKGYYQLIERTADGKANSEIIQANKEVLFVDKATGETIADTNWCREKLGVPYGIKATVRPLSIPDVMTKYEIYVQSNSYTRKLDQGTKFLYELEAR